MLVIDCVIYIYITLRKRKPTTEEVLLFENMLILYKFTSDVCMVVLSDIQENELIILSVLKTLDSSLKTLLKCVCVCVCACVRVYVYIPCVYVWVVVCACVRVCVQRCEQQPLVCNIIVLMNRNQVDQKTLVSNVDLVLLVLDEMIDSGYHLFLFRSP